MKKAIIAAFALSFVLITGCQRDKQQLHAVVFSAAGNISNELQSFRAQLGNLNNTTGMTAGRREVNWDGVPDSLTGQKLESDFFNPTSPGSQVALQRGLIYGGDADPIVSRNSFAEVNPIASTEFQNFSGDKSFAVVNSTLWPVEFRIAGQTTPASVNGFGAVFTDVDKAQSTFIEFYDEQENLGRFYAPVQQNGNRFSFIGVYFPERKATRILIGHEGKLSDGEKDITQGGTMDLVILDDFIYSEPRPK